MAKNTSKTLSIISLVALGLCLILGVVKAVDKKKGEGYDKACAILFFVAVVLIAVSSLLDQVDGFESSEKSLYLAACAKDADCPSGADVKGKFCLKHEVDLQERSLEGCIQDSKCLISKDEPTPGVGFCENPSTGTCKNPPYCNAKPGIGPLIQCCSGSTCTRDPGTANLWGRCKPQALASCLTTPGHACPYNNAAKGKLCLNLENWDTNKGIPLEKCVGALEESPSCMLGGGENVGLCANAFG